MTAVHPIEQESYRILASRVDLSHLPPLSRVVVERAIHATADLEYATSTVVSAETHLERAVDALRDGAPVVTDVEMVRAGISGIAARCHLDGATARDGLTRSAAAMRDAIAAHPRGAIFVVGCAPTALVELLGRAEHGDVEPALVVGMPVGFVGAAESKEALRASGLPAVSNVGEKGGSAVAAAVVNALVRASHREGR